MSNGLIVGFVIVAVIFGILWKNGQLVRLNTYVGETKEELRKCTWPTRDELKGSTLVVIISVAALAAFTVVVDFVVHNLVTFIER
jgi:preprotein translocase subunit SecE